MRDHSFRRLRALATHAAFVVLSLIVSASTALAVTDKRSIQGATSDVGPAIPEPSSIFLFVAGVVIVGYGASRLRRRSH